MPFVVDESFSLLEFSTSKSDSVLAFCWKQNKRSIDYLRVRFKQCYNIDKQIQSTKKVSSILEFHL